MPSPDGPVWARRLASRQHAGRDEARDLAHRAGAALAQRAGADPASGRRGPAAGTGGVPTDQVPLARASGRVLAEDVEAACSVPHYASSAMDGYAVRGPGPWDLVTGGSPSAHSEPGAPVPLPSAASAVALAPGTAVPVVTGGVIPEGTTSVVREEFSCRSGSIVRLAPSAPPSELEGRHIRATGTECQVHEVLFHAGRVLSPADAAFAAVAGLDHLPVRRAPRVALLLTGSEVRTRGVPAPGLVRDAFSMSVPHAVTAYGGVPGTVHRVDDDPASLSTAFREVCAEHDVVLTTGGTSRSGVDHVRPMLERETRVLVDQLDLQPGHPALLGAARRSAVLALPGNPLAALVVVLLVGGPLLAGFSGRAAPGLVPVTVGVDAAGGRREKLVPARRRGDAWEPCRAVGPNMLRGLSEAEGLLSIPRAGLVPGDRTVVLPLPW